MGVLMMVCLRLCVMCVSVMVECDVMCGVCL